MESAFSYQQKDVQVSSLQLPDQGFHTQIAPGRGRVCSLTLIGYQQQIRNFITRSLAFLYSSYLRRLDTKHLFCSRSCCHAWSMGIGRIFYMRDVSGSFQLVARGNNSGEISFYQLEIKRKTFIY